MTSPQGPRGRFPKTAPEWSSARVRGCMSSRTSIAQQERGADIYAEIAGYGATCDAYHRVRLEENGLEPARAMQIAMEDAGITASDIDYVNLHGTATLLNDRIETRALKLSLDGNAHRIPMSATKSQIGHPQGATGSAGRDGSFGFEQRYYSRHDKSRRTRPRLRSRLRSKSIAKSRGQDRVMQLHRLRVEKFCDGFNEALKEGAARQATAAALVGIVGRCKVWVKLDIACSVPTFAG